MALDPKSQDRPRRERPASRLAIVAARFHEDLTGAMVDSALRELGVSGIPRERVLVHWVPGAFELAIVARRVAELSGVEAVLCFGLVLRGETEHDRWVAQGAVQGIVQASQDTGVPILFGVLTCATLEQARARALPPDAGGREDKGREVGRAAIDLLLTLDRIEAQALEELEQP